MFVTTTFRNTKLMLSFQKNGQEAGDTDLPGRCVICVWVGVCARGWVSDTRGCLHKITGNKGGENAPRNQCLVYTLATRVNALIKSKAVKPSRYNFRVLSRERNLNYVLPLIHTSGNRQRIFVWCCAGNALLIPTSLLVVGSGGRAVE